MAHEERWAKQGITEGTKEKGNIWKYDKGWGKP